MCSIKKELHKPLLIFLTKSKVMKIKKPLQFLLCLCLPLVLGAISSKVTRASINNWYAHLEKPFFNPPNWLFAPVWTLLFILMGISWYMFLQAPKSTVYRKNMLFFWIQLILNFLWSFSFFYFKNPILGLINIVLLLPAILIWVKTGTHLNPTASKLQIPYIAWVSFATILTTAIVILN